MSTAGSYYNILSRVSSGGGGVGVGGQGEAPPPPKNLILMIKHHSSHQIKPSLVPRLSPSSLFYTHEFHVNKIARIK